MRQVPNNAQPRYLIIGAGRMAKHFAHYLSLLNIPYQQWCRQQSPSELEALLCDCSHVSLLINDGAIETFIKQTPALAGKTLVHFSGQLVTDLAHSAHPFMTFTEQLYDLPRYQQVPFTLEQEGPDFVDLLPGLENPHYRIPAEHKPLYHALCVMSGNFTCILWNKCFEAIQQNFGIPKASLLPYMQQIFSNIQADHQRALTGPLLRGDKTTIEKNLAALAGDPFQEVYQAFVNAYQAEELAK